MPVIKIALAKGFKIKVFIYILLNQSLEYCKMGSEKMKIVDACPRDIEFIVRVCRETKTLYDPIMEGAFERQALRYENRGFPQEYHMSIIFSKDQQIGFLASKMICEDVIYIVGLYFLKSFQRQGFGKEALDIIRNKVKESGINRMILLVHNKADWALNFYLKYDFKIVGRTMEESISYQREIKDFYIDNTYLMSDELLETIR